ncbi:hypothetical protein LI291_09805 [Intestinibacillus massiliensis]|nr:hypothetical protein [Intestinibacillus massiliensis]
MKKLISGILAACLLCGALAGCGGNRAGDGSPADHTDAQAESQQKEVTPVTVEGDSFRMTPGQFKDNVNNAAKADVITADFVAQELEGGTMYTAPSIHDGVKFVLLQLAGEDNIQVVMVVQPVRDQDQKEENGLPVNTRFDSMCLFAAMVCDPEADEDFYSDVALMPVKARNKISPFDKGNSLKSDQIVCIFENDGDNENFLISSKALGFDA